MEIFKKKIAFDFTAHNNDHTKNIKVIQILATNIKYLNFTDTAEHVFLGRIGQSPGLKVDRYIAALNVTYNINSFRDVHKMQAYIDQGQSPTEGYFNVTRCET